ncbi:MAG: 50S ribosomal protein L3 [Pseudomonadota bacterium]|nr:50S ribosomal protein L3 [Gammaproteobacteria bacterium]MBU1558814.1 50S ribosomal protein L3 [Gammaproteobacteria bacterium]MBU1629382.1 50S ribosomal protein L3 [Gammaproteobacteria bacterium]MBU1926696.1 50S ribosomal protein L3 [Gammaproteobacteria bacterium]MBU2545970.1 50S ribosomal protein L3 [Gammaproteobacteria bacterium]
MAIGLVGKKCGMTRVFTQEGASIPVTVIEVQPNKVTQIRTIENDGYSAIQVTMGKRRLSRVTKPLIGHYAKSGVEPGLGLWEFRVDDLNADLSLGAELTVDVFSDGQIVDVQGVTKGKGFAGVIKRHHFSHQDYTHGNSLSHRVPGSIGQRQTPGRVFKGKKMAGHLGSVVRTIQNLEIVKIDKERNLLLIKGAIPGAPGGYVIVRPAVKRASTSVTEGDK